MAAFLKAWDQYTICSKLLERVFEFLNRFYLKNSKKQSLGVTAMNIFVDTCFSSVKANLIESIM